jgi:hypothetical protein
MPGDVELLLRVGVGAALGPTLGRERPLRADRSGHCVARPCERDEEGVTLGVDLAAVVLVERRPQQAPMLGEHLGVAAAQPRQQPCRPLDVVNRNVTVPLGSSVNKAQLRSITAASQEHPPTAPAQAPL